MKSFKTLHNEFQNGNTDAFEEILIRFEPKLKKLCYLNNNFDEDMFQELSLKLFNAVSKFKLEEVSFTKNQLKKFLS